MSENLENARKPVGEEGAAILTRMNASHTPLSEWAFEHMDIKPDDIVLDIGCGGGANVRRLIAKCPSGHVTGVDYSDVSVRMSTEENKKAIEEGKCTIQQADVMRLPFAEDSFDVVTAFETIYFWPDIHKSLQEVCRVLKAGGHFYPVNEANGTSERDAKTMASIANMQMFTAQQLVDVLTAAGFAHVTTYETPQGWVMADAQKSAQR